MYHRLCILSLLLAVLSCQAQAQTKTARMPATDAAFEGKDSLTSGNSAKEAESRSISRQASNVAKEFYKMGEKYSRAHLFRQAAESFQKAVQLNPRYAEAHYGLGNAYFNMGRWPDAIQSLEQAVKLKPRDEEAHARLGEAYRMLRKEKETRSQNETATPSGVAVSLNVSPVSSAGNSVAKPTDKENDPTQIYRIGNGDVLDVRLGDPSASQSTLYTVTSSGLLEHPNLSEPLAVSGLTVTEIKGHLETDLKRRAISEDPKIHVGIREYLSHAILVSGMVKDPGTKLLRREAIPLYVVVADAQPLAEAGRVTLIRHETGEALNADLSQPLEMNLLVRAGDVITVLANPERFYYVGGDVKAPGEKTFRAGLTLTQAILVAGGFSGKAKAAQVAREGTNGFLQVTSYKFKEINSGKLTDPLIQAGDRITVVK